MKKQINPRLKRMLIGVGIAFLLIAFLMCKIIFLAIYDDYETSSYIVPDYQNQFTLAAQNKLSILGTTKCRNREAFSSYVYEKKFDILVLKEELTNNSGLDRVINYENSSSTLLIYGLTVHSPLPGTKFELDINDGIADPVSSITLKTSGDSIKYIAKNNSLYCYYFKFSSFSIARNDESYDIAAKADGENIPASLLFKKNGKFLYIILMTVRKGEENMEPGLLYSLINK